MSTTTNDTSSSNLLVKGLIALLVGLLTWYLYVSIEVYEETSSTGFSQEANSEEFLAAKIFLQSYDVNTQLYADYRLLYSNKAEGIAPSYEDTIILSDAQVAFPNALTDKVLQWVDGGGHLILAINSSGPEEDFRANSLLSALEVSAYWLDDEDTFEQTETVVINANEQPVRVNFEKAYRLEFPDNNSIFYSAGDDDGATFAQLDWGKGLVSLVTETEVWNNYQIDEFDNVELLLGLTSNSKNVFIFSSKELPHWFIILLDFSPYFVWFGLLLLILALWRAAVRFGPVLKTDEQSYSPFSQHIEAAGEFYWRTDQKQQLLLDLRNSILLAFYKKRPQVRGAEQAKLLHSLSEFSGWEESDLQELLFSESTPNEAQFTRWISALQSLRNTL